MTAPLTLLPLASCILGTYMPLVLDSVSSCPNSSLNTNEKDV